MLDFLVANARLCLSGGVLLSALLLLYAGRRLAQQGSAKAILWMLVGFGMGLWLPLSWGGTVVQVIFVLLILVAVISHGSGGLLLAAIFGGIAYVVARLVPGGEVTLMLGGGLLYGVVELLSQRNKLLRMRRARTLEPGKQSDEEVLLAGCVISRDEQTVPLPLPMDDQACAGWAVELDGETLHRGQPIEIMTEFGSVLVDMATAKCELESQRSKMVDQQEQMDKLRQDFGSDADGDGDKEKDTAYPEVRWLRRDDPVVVVGCPRWQPAPSGRGAGYRDSPLVPVFSAEAGGGTAPYLSNRTAEGVRLNAHWQILYAGAFFAVSLVTLAVHLMRPAF